MREAIRFTGQLMSVTVSRIADRWFASFAVRLDVAPLPCKNQAVVGVDLGVLTLATLSTGETITGPKPLRKLSQVLRRCSKALSRKVKGSANRVKARRKLARLHYRIACQRHDSLHKLTTALTQRFSTVVIEDLHVKGMVKNHHLARAISDMGFGAFRRMLTYKAEAAGVNIVVTDRWFPSSKMCSQCGVVADRLPLGQRVFACTCGFVTDRDLNAALNLHNYPRLVGKYACGEGNGASAVKQGSTGDCPVVVVKLSSTKQERLRMHFGAPLRKQHTMSGETPTYTTYKEFCGNREQPWVTRMSDAVDWTQQETTRDQAHIEAVLDTMAVTGASILHVGVGNSRWVSP
jgi:putative transposase